MIDGKPKAKLFTKKGMAKEKAFELQLQEREKVNQSTENPLHTEDY